MATSSSKPKTKSGQKLLPAGGMRISFRRLLIATSVAVNIGFIVLWFSLAATHSLDGLFMANGLERYCSRDNDDKFVDTQPKVKYLREYVCDAPDADPYFKEGLKKYYEAKGIPTASRE